MVTGVYRPPYSVGLDFQFTEWIVEPLVNSTNLIIMVDFNFHVNNLNDDVVANLTDTITGIGLVHH